MSILGHGEDKYVTGTCLKTSAGNSWEHLLAERWCHKKGELADITPADTEIAVLLAGKSRVTRKGGGEKQECLATPGTVWICPAGIQEEEIVVYGEMEEVIHLYIPPELFSDATLMEFDIDPSHTELNYDGGFQDGLVEHIGRTIAREMDSPTFASGLLVETLRVSLAAHLLRHYSTLSPTRAPLKSVVGALDQKKLSRVIEFVAANLDQKISLKEMANVACLSPHHFARTFKTASGVTPHQYIMSQKLSFAKKLLAQKHYCLIDIAFKAGFTNQAHFTNAFKKATGLTPGAYRSALL